jgi:hypothetical protein
MQTEMGMAMIHKDRSSSAHLRVSLVKLILISTSLHQMVQGADNDEERRKNVAPLRATTHAWVIPSRLRRAKSFAGAKRNRR